MTALKNNLERELIKELKRLVTPNYTVSQTSRQYNIEFTNGTTIVVSKVQNSLIRTTSVSSK